MLIKECILKGICFYFYTYFVLLAFSCLMIRMAANPVNNSVQVNFAFHFYAFSTPPSSYNIFVTFSLLINAFTLSIDIFTFILGFYQI